MCTNPNVLIRIIFRLLNISRQFNLLVNKSSKATKTVCSTATEYCIVFTTNSNIQITQWEQLQHARKMLTVQLSEINIDLYFSMVIDVIVYIFCFLPLMLNLEIK